MERVEWCWCILGRELQGEKTVASNENIRNFCSLSAHDLIVGGGGRRKGKL